MKYIESFDYMTAIIETVADVDNSFLSRRELTCNFAGLAGKLKTLQAVDMIKKQFNLDDKIVISMKLKTHVGKSLVTGTFYVYDDENLAKKHVNPTIFSRLDKIKANMAEEEKASADADASDAASADTAKDSATDTAKDNADTAKDKTSKPEDGS